MHIDNFISNSIVFLRVDFNVPIIDGKISSSKRIDDVIPFIISLLEKNNKLIIASHFGRPKGFDLTHSLRIVYDYLCGRISQYKIFFAEKIDHSYNDLVNKLNYGEILFLENLRFYKEEEENDENFKKLLAEPVEYYINEAFSCSHRTHASIMMAELFSKKKKFIGRLFSKEINAIDGILTDRDNAIAIIGGSKISTKLDVLNTLTKKVGKIIVVGAMANTFLFAKGLDVGKSLYEADYTDVCKKLMLNSDCEIILPRYVVVTDDIRNHKIVQSKSIHSVEDSDIIVDISSESIDEFCKVIEKSRLVLWNGPLGVFEIKPFDNGTLLLGESIIKLTKNGKIKSVIGGGDTVAALENNIDLDDFTHVSTAGGAFLEYIEKDGKLPGLMALNDDK